MSTHESPISELTEDQCWDKLAGTLVGRLATYVSGEAPDVVPVNFVTDGQTLVFRTAAGNKLAELTANDAVSLEIDGWNEEWGWSVLVKGTAARIDNAEEERRAERLPLMPWVPTRKVHYVRITPDTLTGRRFEFGTAPDEPYPPVR